MAAQFMLIVSKAWGDPRNGRRFGGLGWLSVANGAKVFAESLVMFGLSVLLLALPTSIVPMPVIWIYDKVLWCSEPLWQTVEIIGVIHVTLYFSATLADKIDSQPTIFKGLILILSAFCYAIAAHLGLTILYSDSTFICWILLGVFFGLICIHVCTIMADQGVILDSALISMCAVGVVCSVLKEQEATSKMLLTKQWANLPEETTVLKLLTQVTVAGVGGASHAWAFLWWLCSTWFILSAVMRICAVLYGVTLLRQYFLPENDDDDFLEEEITHQSMYSHWQSPLLLQLIIIFVYTQFLSQFLHIASDTSISSWMLTTLFAGRLAQAPLLMLYYIYRLNWSDQQEESYF